VPVLSTHKTEVAPASRWRQCAGSGHFSVPGAQSRQHRQDRQDHGQFLRQHRHGQGNTSEQGRQPVAPYPASASTLAASASSASTLSK
jgi:hypothetical protein